MNNLWNGIISVFLALVGLGIVATLVSKNANTAGVATAVSSGFATDLQAAEAPVTGSSGFLGGGMTLMGAPIG